MAKEKMKKYITLEDLSSQIVGLVESVKFGFDLTAKKFEAIDERFDKVENNLTEIREILEKHTTFLKRLDEERIFTLNYVKRLENEIKKIKIHLKIA